MREEQNKIVYDADKGVKSISVLAKLLGMSAWGVNKWIHKKSIPPKKAKAIVDMSEGRVALDEFSPFIFD